MADRKYQIFVSSTYTDLQEERTQLLFAILKLNYIPAGMEFFTAIDEEQMQYIRRVIDESDYYVLLMGARYGSMDSEGVSYTEREYDYAVSQGKKIIALIHQNPDKIERGKTDKDEELFRKFMAFRDKIIQSKRLIAYWNNIAELIVNFNSSLMQTTKRFPAVGWVRGDIPASTETLQRIAALELENQRLRESVKSASGMQIATDLKMEAYSVTNPRAASDVEIECISMLIKWKEQIIDRFACNTNPSRHSSQELVQHYKEDALPWFVRMARVCRFDLRITNPYQFAIDNLRFEQHLRNENGIDVKIMNSDDALESPPYHPIFGITGYLSDQKPPDTHLNPNQSTQCTQQCFFIPTKDQDLIYQCTFFASNIIEPITKLIKIHFRIKTIELDPNDLIKIIQKYEKRQKLNDIRVFEFVESVLEKERKEQDSCDTQK